MKTPLVIAIDGPSGSGKSTVAKAVARDLGLAYLDTGAMYRAAAVWVAGAGALATPYRMVDLIKLMPLHISLDPDAQTVFLGHRDITELIRTTEVSTDVSKVATVIPARELMVNRQREIVAAEREPTGWAKGRGIVVEGRDITTVVAPDADVRVLLTASEQARLRRRALEVHGTDDAASLAATEDQVVRRDRDDSTVARFMDAPPGVTLVDTSDLTLDQSIQAVLKLVP
jgi:cytidylate kinase